jgi:hypothetical protein
MGIYNLLMNKVALFSDLKFKRNEKQFIKLPRNINDAKNLGLVLQKYNKNHYYSVLAAFFSAYVL